MKRSIKTSRRKQKISSCAEKCLAVEIENLWPKKKRKIKIFNGVLMKLLMSLRINFFAYSSHVNAVETQAFYVFPCWMSSVPCKQKYFSCPFSKFQWGNDLISPVFGGQNTKNPAPGKQWQQNCKMFCHETCSCPRNAKPQEIQTSSVLILMASVSLCRHQAS